MTLNVDYTLLPSEQAFVPHLSCKGVSCRVCVVPCCLDSAPHDRDSVVAVALRIGVTSSSHELSCRLGKRRRRLQKAAKKKLTNRASTIWFRSSEGAWKSRDKERGRDEPKDSLRWTSDKRTTIQDDHWTSRRRANSR